MDIKIVKEKTPEVKIKKEAEVSIHKKNLIAAKTEDRAAFHVKDSSDFFGNKKVERQESKNKKIPAEERKGKSSPSASPVRKKDKVAETLQGTGRGGAERTGKGSLAAYQKKAAAAAKKTDARNPASYSIPLPGRERSLPAGDAAAPVSTEAMQKAGVLTSREAKEDFKRRKKVKSLSEIPKIHPEKNEIAVKGVKQGGKAILTQLEGGEEANEALSVMTAANRPFHSIGEKRKYAKAEEKLKIRQADQKISSRQLRKELQKTKKGIAEKQSQQAARQRKMQYIINKLTGSGEQDSLLQTAKDIVRMKTSFVMVKVVKFIGALLAPLFGILFMAAFPVVLIVMLLYCSPLGAFMENPSDETPSIQEVLSGYYMEFNQSVSANAGENGAISYLHEKDGNYVSNYMDTLMVYMVQYGTGDLGIVMDEDHKQLLKEIFDEMNSFEDTTVTTTIQAGQSLGNVVTSAYCSCPICCGVWSGGPTASGVMPTANHTLAVDANNPFVPMGTKIIMNGTEYVVEDTGNFDQYGVQFDIYFEDHATATSWGHQTMEAFLADGDENTISVTRRGSYVKNMDYEDYIALGKLTAEQEELLREAMSEEFRSEIPSFGVGSDVANLALTKVGCRYSQALRYSEGYYDCSSLVQRCYAEFGVTLPATASTQGKYIVDHGLEVTEDMLEPGDLIFYSYENNGEFLNISHVAIYIGNGRMVHAANTARGVVNDPFIPTNVGLYGRPSLGQ